MNKSKYQTNKKTTSQNDLIKNSIPLDSFEASWHTTVRAELVRVIFHTLFWGLCAGAAILAFKQGWWTKETDIPPLIEHYIVERSNIFIYLFEFVLLALVAGIFALFGVPSMVKIAQEEVSRILYTIGTFVGWFICVATAISILPNVNYGAAFGIWFGYCLFGVMFAVYATKLAK